MLEVGQPYRLLQSTSFWELPMNFNIVSFEASDPYVFYPVSIEKDIMNFAFQSLTTGEIKDSYDVVFVSSSGHRLQGKYTEKEMPEVFAKIVV